MGLTLYKKKRNFKSTSEPTGGGNAGGRLRFVVQKHDASHLHYDFRLEMEGVLKSWAVPKGPSLDPSIKRLAMMVEDHPFDYRNFEGIIPEGNYGAGTVIVWDEGTYEPANSEAGDKKSQEKQLLADLKKKRLKFILHGKKLKGEFALVKTYSGAENGWLLMKVNDQYATDEDITLKEKSVVTKRTLAQVAKDNGIAPKQRSSKKTVAKKTASPAAKKKAPPEINPGNDTGKNAIGDILAKCPKSSFPKPFRPMLATRVSKPFDGSDWIYEIKWDGYRAVAYCHKHKVNIYSRNLLSFNARFVPVVEALAQWGADAVLDGEIVALNEEDRPDFQLLQNHASNEDIHFAYYVFDIIWYDGRDLTGLDLLSRKSILQAVIPANDPVIRYSSHVAATGKDFFNVAVKHGLEGVMAKRSGSAYAINQRSGEWLKIKNDQRLEAIICGFTSPRNSRSYFGAVILGKYNGDKLEYIGHSGSGFNEKSLEELYRRFQPLITDKNPFPKKPKTNMPVTWLKPEIVCEVKYTEWTSEKILRHPIFLGLREDKKAANEKNEKIVKPPATKKAAPAKTTPAKKKTASAKKDTGMKEVVSDAAKEEVIKVKGHPLKLTNLNKVYWPKENITKRDLINYYAAIAPYILPYMKDRPQSLNRHPDGIDKPNFYNKNVSNSAPDWIRRRWPRWPARPPIRRAPSTARCRYSTRR